MRFDKGGDLIGGDVCFEDCTAGAGLEIEDHLLEIEDCGEDSHRVYTFGVSDRYLEKLKKLSADMLGLLTIMCSGC